MRWNGAMKMPKFMRSAVPMWGVVSARSGRGKLLVRDLEHALALAKALQREAPQVVEAERLPGGELAHHVRDQDLPGPGPGGDARRGLHGGAEEVRVLGHRLAGVESDANEDGVLPPAVVGGERLLDRDRAFERAARRGKRRHEAVAHALQLRAAVLGQALADERVVRAQELVGRGVAEALRERRGADQVGAEDGEEAGAGIAGGRLGLALLVGEELVHRLENGLRVADPRVAGSARQRQEVGIGQERRELPAGAEWHRRVLATVE